MKHLYVCFLILSIFLLKTHGKNRFYRVKKSIINNKTSDNILKCKDGITSHCTISNDEPFIDNIIENKRIFKRESALKEKKNKLKIVPSTLKFTPEKCNNDELQSIIIDNIIPDEPNESKKRIHKVTNDILPIKDGNKSHYDVICSSSPFSFRIATQVFCEMTIKKVTCFVYQQIGSKKVQK